MLTAVFAACCALGLAQGQMMPMPMANAAMMPMAPAMSPMMMMNGAMMPGRKMLQSMGMAPMMMNMNSMAPMSGMMAPNVFAAVQMNANLSVLATALMKANLSMALSDPMFMGTVFAPTNDAFMRYLGARNMTADQLLASPDLKTILQYHVVPGTAAMASMLMNGMKLSTMANSPLMIAAMPAPVTVFGAQSNAIVQMADMKAGKAIIHIINQVLLPPTSKMSS